MPLTARELLQSVMADARAEAETAENTAMLPAESPQANRLVDEPAQQDEPPMTESGAAVEFTLPTEAANDAPTEPAGDDADNGDAPRSIQSPLDDPPLDEWGEPLQAPEPPPQENEPDDAPPPSDAAQELDHPQEHREQIEVVDLPDVDASGNYADRVEWSDDEDLSGMLEEFAREAAKDVGAAMVEQYGRMRAAWRSELNDFMALLDRGGSL